MKHSQTYTLLQSSRALKIANFIAVFTNLGPNLAAHGKGRERTSELASLIKMADVELHAAVVFGCDKLISP